MGKAACGAHPDGENDAAPQESLTLFRKGSTLCALTKITAYLLNELGVLKFLLFYWAFWEFFIQKNSVPSIRPQVCSQCNQRILGIIWKTELSIVFQVFPAERNLPSDNLVSFEHQNTPKSFMEANI